MRAWNELDTEAKQELKLVFKQGDKDGDNTWSREELRQFLETNFGPDQAARLQDLWSLVDADGDGSLDFYEVGTLVYVVGLEKTSCGLCREPIFDDAMRACRTCCAQHVQCNGQRPDGWVAVCEGCYGKQRSRDCCPNDPSHVLERVAHDPFVTLTESPLYRELALASRSFRSSYGPLPPPTPPQQPHGLVSCQCCNTSHALVPGYLKGSGGSHMVPAPGGWGYICELCAVWMCESCGTQGCDVHHPQVGKWRKTLVHVDKCTRVGEGRWRFDARSLATASADTSRPQCPTCQVTFPHAATAQQAQEAAAQQAAQAAAAQAAAAQAAAAHAAQQAAQAAQQAAEVHRAQMKAELKAELRKEQKKEARNELLVKGAVVGVAAVAGCSIM
ncbi:hypothetical protein HYH03_012468 [Edaphochlamys debaryana]|uniref:EF-hand domain-containing protein n=1 Tax=Edaphochlamys debaryana TaxID=47281 RepID=A0A835XST2_9CHLO|nr:hypothetical protein HYH03_012468 [Edaphochlamys debaryana]|eukprot:KAG2489030.1 hypothetical protein HYH03_012468 [Edaphochlamys debaryana]